MKKLKGKKNKKKKVLPLKQNGYWSKVHRREGKRTTKKKRDVSFSTGDFKLDVYMRVCQRKITYSFFFKGKHSKCLLSWFVYKRLILPRVSKKKKKKKKKWLNEIEARRTNPSSSHP